MVDHIDDLNDFGNNPADPENPANPENLADPENPANQGNSVNEDKDEGNNVTVHFDDFDENAVAQPIEETEPNEPVQPDVASGGGPEHYAQQWEGQELDLLLALRRGLEGIDMSYLCDESNLDQPQHLMPVSGTLVFTKSNYVIQTNADETKPVSFADIVKIRSINGEEELLFVVKTVKQLASHLFQVEPVTLPENEETPEDHGLSVVIYPFTLPAPPNAACKRFTAGAFLEQNLYLTTDGITKLMKTLQQEAPEEVDLSDGEVVARAIAKFADRVNPTKTNDCPYPLVDGACVDVGTVKTADQDSDIRSSQLYIQDALNVTTKLADLIGKRDANTLMAMCMVDKKDYDAMLLQNTLVWGRYRKQNLDVATSLHFVLQALVKHYVYAVTQMSVHNRSKIDNATTTWLEFYIRMPVFFFEATQSLSRFMGPRNTTNDIKYEIADIVQKFQASLQKHVEVFLPHENDSNSQLLRNIRNMLKSLGSVGKQFQYLPPAFIL